ncbi:PepSY domain-containing protein [Aestuariibacter sp. AA17]|uniref:PepSY domain-containing protein n=1 Tax=Fluctibacter corallii TaxID=2984329 RepID=A0ABT3A8E2_9ALTE|nr:PepSY-associated TM helix domain-containing protein [Aestuariibacter sp. AA17]MCV2884867.1 PepSY domain-containing protein [Aestuariibacter sp. AA17]
MIWLHTYSGLLLGWLLFAIFLTGTLSYFSTELTHWMRGGQVSQHWEKTVHVAFDALADTKDEAKNWQITLPDERGAEARIQWRDNENKRHTIEQDNVHVNTAGGRFFVAFHYTLNLREYGGRYLAGIAAIAMIVAIISGIFTHRRIIQDFFVVRARPLLKLVTDAHAIVGIVTLPFCFLICFSALAIYISLYVPWFANAHFEHGVRDIDKQITARYQTITPSAEISSQLTPTPDLKAILQDVNTHWSAKQVPVIPIRISVDAPFTAQGRIIVWGIEPTWVSNKLVSRAYSWKHGAFIAFDDKEPFAREVRRALYGYHEAHFAQTGLRWLLFLSGIASTFLIGSGCIIWFNKRKDKVKHLSIGHRLVDKLNIAVIGGLPMACAAFFSTNRMLPTTVVDRAGWEVLAFFVAWAVAFVIACLCKRQRAWLLILWLSCGLFTVSAALSLAKGMWTEHAVSSLYWWVTCLMVFSAAVNLLIAKALQRRWSKAAC